MICFSSKCCPLDSNSDTSSLSGGWPTISWWEMHRHEHSPRGDVGNTGAGAAPIGCAQINTCPLCGPVTRPSLRAESRLPSNPLHPQKHCRPGVDSWRSHTYGRDHLFGKTGWASIGQEEQRHQHSPRSDVGNTGGRRLPGVS